MSLLIRMAAVGVTATAAFAQPPTNLFEIYPVNTTFTTRAGANTTDADVVIKVVRPPCEGFAGVGQFTDPVSGVVVGRVNGFQNVIQDQNAATQENFAYVILGDNGGGLPGADLVRTANLQPPVGVGIVAWNISANLATPFDALPQTGCWFMGVFMQSNPAWTNDGLSNHSASFTTAPGDQPRAGFLNTDITHTVQRPSGTLGLPATQRTMRVGILTEGIVGNPGQDVAGVSEFGWGGNRPDNINRLDGISFRIRDLAGAGNPNFIYIIVGAFRCLSVGIPLPNPPFENLLYLDPSSFLLGGAPLVQGTMGANGELTATWIAQGNQILPLFAVCLYYQVLCVCPVCNRVVFGNLICVSHC